MGITDFKKLYLCGMFRKGDIMTCSTKQKHTGGGSVCIRIVL